MAFNAFSPSSFQSCCQLSSLFDPMSPTARPCDAKVEVPMLVEKKRRRPAVSCLLCRKRKIRCNRETPCSNCRRSKNKVCVYENQSGRPPLSRITTNNTRALPTPASSGLDFGLDSGVTLGSLNPLATPPGHQPGGNVGGDLGRHSSDTPPIQQNGDFLTTTGVASFASSEIQFSPPDVTAPSSNRIMMNKSRLFGPSHWLNGATLFLDIFQMFEKQSLEQHSKAVVILKKCKFLARSIKAARSDRPQSEPGLHMPPREVADKLVQCYLRTTETVLRVLHVPSFTRDYEAYWTSPESVDPAFVMQLKLVMAIGAATYDDTFSMRVSAVHWVQEARDWRTPAKSRLNIPSLQIMILLCIACETTAIGADLVWISAGALLRTAMYMGLHRDPSRLPNRPFFFAEMRRRLWNTILEILVQSSVESGGPPMISLTDFDTEAPGNFDDDQLFENGDAEPVAKPSDIYTQSSMAIALRRTFPVRLAIVRFLNDFKSRGTYAETVQYDAELKAAFKDLSRTLRAYPANGPSPSHFEVRMVDFVVRRYMLALHMPCLGLAMHESAYAFSRKMAVESSLKLWRAAVPPSAPTPLSVSPDFETNHPDEIDEDDFARLTICGAGFYRGVPMQACLVIILELQSELQEEDGLEPVQLRPDLVAVLHEAKEWCFKRIRAGETNVKGYIFTTVLSAHIEAMVKGLPMEQVERAMVDAAEESGQKCLALMEEINKRSRSDGGNDIGECSSETMSDPMVVGDDSWNNVDTMADVQFSFTEPFFGPNWLFSETPPDMPSW